MYEIFVVLVSVRRPQRPVFDELEADDVHFVLILSDEKRIVPPFFIGETDGERVVVTDFDGDFDVDQMVLSISSVIKDTRFIPGKTLVILDEIQDCPNARSSLKYWDMDGRYDVIATGNNGAYVKDKISNFY